MPAQNTDKHYKISDVANILKVSQNVIRKWESRYDIKVTRNKLNHRVYTQEDLERLKNLQKRINSKATVLKNFQEKQLENKKYFKIADAAHILSVSQNVLRKWEQNYEIEIPRNKNGHRVYSQDEIEKLKELQKRINSRDVVAKRYHLKQARKFLKPIKKAQLVGTALIVLFLITLAAFPVFPIIESVKNVLNSKIERQKIATSQKEPIDKANTNVLGERNKATNFVFEVNIPTNLGDTLTVEGPAIFEDTITTGGVSLTGAGNLGGLTSIDVQTGTTLETSLELAGDVTGPLNNTSLADDITFDGDFESSGTLNITGELQADGDAGEDGQVLTSTGSTVEWLDIDADDSDTLDSLDSLQFLRSDTSDSFTSGTLSFSDGTFLDLSAITHNDTAPQGIKLPQNTTLTAPSSGEGYLAYDTSANKVYIYNGTAWTDISGSSTPLQEAYDSGSAIQMSAASGDLRIYNDGANEILFLDESSGYAGIGTTAPSSALDVVGNITVSGTVDGKDIATNAAMLNEAETITANWVNTANPWDISSETNLAVSGTLLDLTGDTLSINEGTLTDGKICTYSSANGLVCNTDDSDTTYTAGNDLDLSGTIFNIESQLDYVSTISQASADLTLQTTTSGDIILNPAGYVGIGTTNPNYALDVTGTAGFNSTISAPSIGADTDNSVVVLNSSGLLKTDEIDSRVWGSTLLDDDFVNVTGDTMTGPLTVLRVNPGEVSTKPDDIEFFDTWIGSGSEDGAKIIVHNKVEARTGEIYIDQYGRFLLNSPNDNLILTASEGVLIESLTFSGADISSTAAIMTLEPNKDDTAIGRLAVQLTQNKQIYFQYDEDGVSENIIEFSDLPIRTTGSLKIGGEEDVVQEIVKANSTQTANLVEFRNSVGTALSAFEGDGDLNMKNAGILFNDSNARIQTTSSSRMQFIVNTDATHINGTYFIGTQATDTYSNGFHIYNTKSIGGTESFNNIQLQGRYTGTGTQPLIRGMLNLVRNSSTGTITSAYALHGRVDNESTGTIGSASAAYIDSNINSGGGTITNNYGINVGSQTAGVNNYAIYTNTGLNRFGDALNIVGSSDTEQLIVKAHSTQTSNLAEWQDSSGNGLVVIDGSGNVGIGTTSPNHTLDVAGNIGLSASSYINWGTTDGSGGYGLRDNAGSIEFKNSGGSWAGIGSGGSSLWTENGSDIYYDSGNVAIGKTSPSTALDVVGTVTASTSVSTPTLALTGTGTINGLDSVDSTTENTIEGLIFDADAENISGVWEVQDNVAFNFGNDADFSLTYDETTDDRLELSDGTNNFLTMSDLGTTAEIFFNGGNVVFDGSGNVGIGTTAPTQITTQPTVVTSSRSDGGDISLTLPEEVNLLVAFYTIGRSTTNIASLDYNGDSFTKEVEVDDTSPDSGRGASTAMWYLKNPDTGLSYTVNSPIADGTYSYDSLVVIGIAGADVSGSDDPIRGTEATFGNGDDSGGDISDSITSATNDLVIDGVASWRNVAPTVGTAGQTAIETAANVGTSWADGASSVTMEWDLNYTGTNGYAWVIASIKPNSSSVVLDVAGDIQYTGEISDVSDIRLKTNIANLEDSLEKIKTLGGFTFNMITSDGGYDRNTQIGLSAQDVQEVFPEAVTIIDSQGHLGLDYTQLVPPLIESVKSLDAKIDNIQPTDISGLESDLEGVKSDIAMINDVLGLSDISESTESTESSSTLSGLTDLINEMTSIFNEFKEFTEALGLSKVTDEDGNDMLAVNSDMNVTGSTTLSDVNITGDLMAGLIKIDSIENSISIQGPDCTLSTNNTLCDTQTLYLQKNLAGNVDIFNGEIVLTPEGTIKATTVVTSVYTVRENENNSTIGTATILKTTKEIFIKTNHIEKNSRIFITPTTNTSGEPIYVKDKQEGTGFTAAINNSLDKDIEFDWWIVKTE